MLYILTIVDFIDYSNEDVFAIKSQMEWRDWFYMEYLGVEANSNKMISTILDNTGY